MTATGENRYDRATHDISEIRVRPQPLVSESGT